MRRARLVTVVATALLLVLHNNWWSWKPDMTLVFGSLPVELLYRVLWVCGATGVLWFAIRGWWGASDD